MVAIAAAACGPMTPTGAAGSNGPTNNGGSPVCNAGYWQGDEGADMAPGRDCVGCHASSGGEAPHYVMGGTVFADYNAADNCLSGVGGATVTITDTAGHVFTKTTNYDGNFAFSDAETVGLTYPITATVEKNGTRSVMTAGQMSGACNTCHSWQGSGGAPGRVVVQ